MGARWGPGELPSVEMTEPKLSSWANCRPGLLPPPAMGLRGTRGRKRPVGEKSHLGLASPVISEDQWILEVRFIVKSSVPRSRSADTSGGQPRARRRSVAETLSEPTRHSAPADASPPGKARTGKKCDVCGIPSITRQSVL